MAYVITDACTKDAKCVDVCPVECIHPTKDDPDFETATQLYINPDDCIDCGACPTECEFDALFALDELPADKAEFIEKNRAYFN